MPCTSTAIIPILNLQNAIPSPTYVTIIRRQDEELNFPDGNTETRMARWIPNL
jgi:hypothetical protein